MRGTILCHCCASLLAPANLDDLYRAGRDEWVMTLSFPLYLSSTPMARLAHTSDALLFSLPVHDGWGVTSRVRLARLSLSIS
jgi:hypothetical protein